MNQMPQNTALNITAPHQPSSYAEIQAAHEARRRKWWKIARTAEPITAPRERPPLPRPRVQITHAVTTPGDFIRIMCAEINYDLAVVQRGQIDRSTADKRDLLIKAVHERFPKISLRKLSKLVRSSYETVRSAIASEVNGEPKRPRNDVPVEHIIALANAGYPQYEIAEKAGCSASAVSKTLRSRSGKTARRMIEDYEARIEALFDEGMTFARIAEQFDFCPSAVSKLVAKKGWKR